ncbi:hypothetical protein V565_338380, partial [Rhizoctonia solani 123E]
MSTLVRTSAVKADLLKGFCKNELDDYVVEWRNETENGYNSMEHPRGHVLVRAMNTFSLVNHSGLLCQPNSLNYESCSQADQVHLVGWVTPLSTGIKRFFRVVSGFWPPPEFDTDLDVIDGVWRMDVGVLRVRIRELYIGSVTIYGCVINGIFARGWNEKVDYWLQHPASEFEPLWERICIMHPEIRHSRFKDLDPALPNDGRMHPWVLQMIRLEHALPAVHADDQAFDHELDDEEDISDAESLPRDDDAGFPTGSMWRAYRFRPSAQFNNYCSLSGSEGNEDGGGSNLSSQANEADNTVAGVDEFQ